MVYEQGSDMAFHPDTSPAFKGGEDIIDRFEQVVGGEENASHRTTTKPSPKSISPNPSLQATQ